MLLTRGVGGGGGPGFRNLMFPSWLALLGGFSVFLDVGPSILFLAFPLFGCFGLFMIGMVSPSSH